MEGGEAALEPATFKLKAITLILRPQKASL